MCHSDPVVGLFACIFYVILVKQVLKIIGIYLRSQVSVYWTNGHLVIYLYTGMYNRDYMQGLLIFYFMVFVQTNFKTKRAQLLLSQDKGETP